MKKRISTIFKKNKSSNTSIKDEESMDLDQIGEFHSYAELGASGQEEPLPNFAQSVSDQTSAHSLDAAIIEGSHKGVDRYKSIYAIAMQYGCTIKKYKYTTDDGYINTVFRLLKKSTAAVIGR